MPYLFAENILRAFTISLLALLSAIAGLLWLDGARAGRQEERLLVYCAPSVQQLAEPLLQRVAEEQGITLSVQIAASGALESQIKLSEKGDLFIPAAATPYLDLLQGEGWVTEAYPLITMQLVIAARHRPIPATVRELVSGEKSFGLANEQAAAGWWTRQALQQSGLGSDAWENAKVFFPTVTELAEAVRTGQEIDAAIIWDTTAKQLGLLIEKPIELESATTSVDVGVLSCSRRPHVARQFAQQLAQLIQEDDSLPYAFEPATQ